MRLIKSGILGGCFAYLVKDEFSTFIVVSPGPMLHLFDHYSTAVELGSGLPAVKTAALIGYAKDYDGQVITHFPHPEVIFDQIIQDQITFEEWRQRFVQRERDQAHSARQAETERLRHERQVKVGVLLRFIRENIPPSGQEIITEAL